MSMYAMTPYRREHGMPRFFDDFEKDFFNGFPTITAAFRTDIEDAGDHYVMKSELPGFSKEDINIDINGECMTVRAVHEESEEEKKKNFVRRERSYGSFSRSFDISGIDANGIAAKYENGILELTLPKMKEKALEGKKIIID